MTKKLRVYLETCQGLLTKALGELGAAPGADEVRRMARLIVEGVTGPHRHFHTPEHLFMVAGEDDPVEILAGLYHDLLYVQVDRAIFLNLACPVAGVVWQDGDLLVIREEDGLPGDAWVTLVLDIFGFAPGQSLSPLGGQNEFLSALVAAGELAPHLGMADLARVCACIELTIPFRLPREGDGAEATDRLHARLERVERKLGLGLGERGLEEAVKSAVRLAKRDLSGFGHDVAEFMDNTWSLLPETNHFLVNRNSYSVADFRASLHNSYRFFMGLEAERIFHSFRGVPDSGEVARLTERARHNLAVGRLYLAAKLVALAALEALAARVDSRMPVASLLEQDPAGLPRGVQPEPYPVHGAAPELPDRVAQDTYRLLAEGRIQESDYDLSNSPIAAHFFCLLGAEGIRSRMERAEAYFAGEVTGDELLALLPAELISPIRQRIVGLMQQRIEAVLREP